MTCAVCQGSGWVCEDHPATPFQHDDCGGAGVKCVCNPEAAVRWQKVFAEVPREPEEPLH